MLYEVFADGESKLFFMTNKPFNAKEARKLLPAANSVAVRPVKEFYYDTTSFICLDDVSYDIVGKVVGALVRKEVENVSRDNSGEIRAVGQDD